MGCVSAEYFVTNVSRPTSEHRNANILNLSIKVPLSLAELNLHNPVNNAGKCHDRPAKYLGTVCTAVQYGLKNLVQPLSRRLALDFEAKAPRD